MQAGGVMQGFVGLAQIVRDGLPQRMFDHRETPLRLVHRRRTRAADFFGVPGFGDQALQLRLDLLALGSRQVAMILSRQLRGDGVVFLNERASRDFGRMGCEDQLDVQSPQLPRQGFCVVTFSSQASQQFRQYPGLERRGL